MLRMLALSFFGLLLVSGCNEDKSLTIDSGPPFEGIWSGTYADTNNVLRPLSLSLKVDSTNGISGTYIIDIIDSLGQLVTATGAAAGTATTDTSGTVFLENDAFRWRLTGDISPPFRFAGNWLSLSSPGRFGVFSVTK